MMMKRVCILDTDNIRVNAAYEKARQARFEFGEKG